MIESIRFANYRAFKDEGILVLRPVTLLIGRNSSGKSSLCRLVQFISYALKSNEWPSKETSSTGFCTSYSDLFFQRNTSTLLIGADFEGGVGFRARYYDDRKSKMQLSYREVYTKDDDKIESDIDLLREKLNGILDDNSLVELNVQRDMLSYDVTYIHSLRSGAKDVYRQVDADITDKVGSDGVGAYSILLNSYIKKTRLFDDVANWMEENVDGQRVDIYRELDNFYFKIYRAGNSVGIQEVGQGISQMLPIIVQSFVQRPHSVTIVEEPELHLHPSAHAAVMERMAESAKQTNSIFVIETHSENMVLAVRRMVSRGLLSPDDVSIAYIDLDNDSGEAMLKPIGVNPNGSLKWWPVGVFSESYDLLNDILG